MIWNLHTTKPRIANEIGEELLPELAHFASTQPDAHARMIPDYVPKPGDTADFVAMEQAKVAVAREPHRKRVLEQFPDVERQAKAAIYAASSLAKTLGTEQSTFHVTISGHEDTTHAALERVVVSIDRVT